MDKRVPPPGGRGEDTADTAVEDIAVSDALGRGVLRRFPVQRRLASCSLHATVPAEVAIPRPLRLAQRPHFHLKLVAYWSRGRGYDFD